MYRVPLFIDVDGVDEIAIATDNAAVAAAMIAAPGIRQPSR
jgi:hypothetical protein